MISKSRECDGADGLPLVHDPGEWRVPEPLLMEVPLEGLIHPHRAMMCGPMAARLTSKAKSIASGVWEKGRS